MNATKLTYILASIEFFIAWCAWMIIGFFAGYLPGWKAGYALLHSFSVQKYFEKIPYETLSNMAKGKYDVEKASFPYSKEDIKFYIFIMNPKNRHGLRALMAGIFLSVAIAMGVDWLILYIAVTALFLFGITKLVQGSMDIL